MSQVCWSEIHGLQYEMASTFRDFFKSENGSVSGLNQLVQTKAPLGDEWSKEELANLADLLGRTIEENNDISLGLQLSLKLSVFQKLKLEPDLQ